MTSLVAQAMYMEQTPSDSGAAPPPGSGSVPSGSCCVRTSGTIQTTPHSTPTREPTCVRVCSDGA